MNVAIFIFSFFATIGLYFSIIIIIGLLVQLKEQNEQIQLQLSSIYICKQE